MSALTDEQYKQITESAGWSWDYMSDQERDMMRAVAEAAIAADRAARAEPVAWATTAGVAAIQAARLGRADNVQIPLSTYPGGDHSVGIYTAPPAAPVIPQCFMTAESDNGGYRLVMKFQSRVDLHKAHDAMIAMLAAAHEAKRNGGAA